MWIPRRSTGRGSTRSRRARSGASRVDSRGGPGRARQSKRTGPSGIHPLRYCTRSRNVASAQWTSSNRRRLAARARAPRARLAVRRRSLRASLRLSSGAEYLTYRPERDALAVRRASARPARVPRSRVRRATRVRGATCRFRALRTTVTSRGFPSAGARVRGQEPAELVLGPPSARRADVATLSRHVDRHLRR